MPLIHTLGEVPLIAILRGVRPDEADAIADILIETGFRIIEVPLNSPDPLRSIESIKRRHPAAIVGAGTVLHPDDVNAVKNAGGELILMPHSDPAVLRRAKELGMICVPGVVTPTEGFAAVANGADALKLFPAETIPPAVIKSWRAVFPGDLLLLPVGGITPEKMLDYWIAGARGFGLGSALYKPEMSATELRMTAIRFQAATANFRRTNLT